jgi:hypothetical protein
MSSTPRRASTTDGARPLRYSGSRAVVHPLTPKRMFALSARCHSRPPELAGPGRHTWTTAGSAEGERASVSVSCGEDRGSLSRAFDVDVRRPMLAPRSQHLAVMSCGEAAVDALRVCGVVRTRPVLLMPMGVVELEAPVLDTGDPLSCHLIETIGPMRKTARLFSAALGLALIGPSAAFAIQSRE